MEKHSENHWQFSKITRLWEQHKSLIFKKPLASVGLKQVLILKSQSEIRCGAGNDDPRKHSSQWLTLFVEPNLVKCKLSVVMGLMIWWFKKSRLVRVTSCDDYLSPNVIGLAEDVETAWPLQMIQMGRDGYEDWRSKTFFAVADFEQFDSLILKTRELRIIVGRHQIFIGTL